MKHEEVRFVKHPKSGVVFRQTAIMKKMRPDLIPCTQNGTSLSYEHADMPYLYNPFNGKIIPNTGDNARITGLIPCRDEEHAASIKAELMDFHADESDEPVETGGLTEPSVSKVVEPIPTTSLDAPEKPDTALIEKLKLTNVDQMDKAALKAFAMENFSEKLNGRLGEDVLREQVQVMINAKVSEAV